MTVTTADIYKAVYTLLRNGSVATIWSGENMPEGEVEQERVVVHVKDISYGRTWSKCFVEVNVVVPDLKKSMANLVRLETLEREYSTLLSQGTGVVEGVRYRLKRDRVSVIASSQLKAHYVNCRLLFEFLNTLEQWQQYQQ